MEIWDAETGALQHRLGSAGFVSSLAVSPTGSRLAALITGKNGTVRLYNLSTRRLERTLPAGELDPSPGAVTFSPDGNFIYFVSYPPGGLGTLYRVPTLGGVPVALVEDIDTSPTFSPEGSKLAFTRGYPTGVNSLMTAAVNGDGLTVLSAPSGEDRLSLAGAPASPDSRCAGTGAGHLRERHGLLVLGAGRRREARSPNSPDSGVRRVACWLSSRAPSARFAPLPSVDSP